MAAAEEDEREDARRVLDAQESEVHMNGPSRNAFPPAAVCSSRQTPTLPTSKANSALAAPVLSALGFSSVLDLET